MITNLADHQEEYSHDQINRYLKADKLMLRLLWQNVKPTIVSDQAKLMYVLFDDTVSGRKTLIKMPAKAIA